VLGYGAFLTILLNFIILAFIIFWMVKAIAKAKPKLDAPEAGPTEEVLLLREIRDSLKRP
jgi:large conductance mechanosensitive channel